MCTFIINRSTGVHNFQSKKNERKWTSTTKGTAFCINYIKKRSYIFTICRNLILIYRCFLIDAILQKLPPIGGHIVDQHVKIPYLKKFNLGSFVVFDRRNLAWVIREADYKKA